MHSVSSSALMAWANHVLGQTHRWYFILACGKVLRVIFLNGRPESSWSRSQKSIALSSCESEYLAAAVEEPKAFTSEGYGHSL